MAALASVIEQGRIGQIRKINIAEGLVALARAIEARGLPKLEEFSNGLYGQNYTARGFGALTLAFVRGCPNLFFLDLRCPDESREPDFVKAMIEGMLQVAGRTANVEV